MPAATIARRRFLATMAATLGTGWWLPRAYGITLRHLQLPDYPFTLGVASGDPLPEGFVLWTRLAPKPLEGGGMPAENIAVTWEVARDEAMTDVVQRGTTVATPGLGHSVHVEVGGLLPNCWYWYRFQAGGHASPVGRVRTLPLMKTEPGRLRLAFMSCQHYEQGYYTAYRDFPQQNLDLAFHLGDYIYEYAAGVGGKIRTHVGAEINSLADYRNRHAQYKSDPDLQTAHASCPWMVVWDDHEFDNNYADRISEEKGINEDEFMVRRAHAYQAYYEHMPLRAASIPRGRDMQLYRRLNYGRLAQFDCLDTRQYRTDQPCGDGLKDPCPEAFANSGTLLGRAQEEWLLEGLKESVGTWNVLAQQVMMGRVDMRLGEAVGLSMDQWPGYEANRQRILQFWRDHQISNPIVLTGDIHSNWVNNLQVDEKAADSPAVATEFVATSISSGGNGSEAVGVFARLQEENPFVQYHNAQRGYVLCEVTPQTWTSHYRLMDVVETPDGTIRTAATFVVEAGRAGANQA